MSAHRRKQLVAFLENHQGIKSLFKGVALYIGLIICAVVVGGILEFVHLCIKGLATL